MAALTPPARPCCVMSRPGPAAPAGWRDSRSNRAGEDGDEVCSPQEPARGESGSQRPEILGPCVGVGRDQPRGCGQGMSPTPSLRCRRNFGSYETTAKISPAPKGQDVGLEFKNQPGQLKRVSKLQTCKAAFSRLDPAQRFVFVFPKTASGTSQHLLFARCSENVQSLSWQKGSASSQVLVVLPQAQLQVLPDRNSLVTPCGNHQVLSCPQKAR
ncbi:uncharacterized protein RBU47_005712 [Passerculus sandwichensis]